MDVSNNRGLGAGQTAQYRLRMHSRARRSMAMLRAIGMRFGLGTDFGGTGLGHGFMGVTGHMELEDMVELGLTPAGDNYRGDAELSRDPRTRPARDDRRREKR